MSLLRFAYMNVSNSLSLLPKNPAHKIRFCERIVPAIVIGAIFWDGHPASD